MGARGFPDFPKKQNNNVQMLKTDAVDGVKKDRKAHRGPPASELVFARGMNLTALARCPKKSMCFELNKNSSESIRVAVKSTIMHWFFK